MKATIGKEGLEKSWQVKFDEEIPCVHCGKPARIAFVAHEGVEDGDTFADGMKFVTNLHHNEIANGGDFWVHDCMACAVYLCTKCCEATAIWNQG